MPATDSSYVQLFNVQWPWYHFGEENWILFLFHQACKFVYCMQYSLHSYGYLFIQNDIGTKKICSNCVPTWHEVKRRTTQPDPCLLNKCILWKHPRSTKKIQLYRHKWGKRKSPMCQQNDNYIQFTYVHLMKSKKLHIQWRKLLTLLSIYIYVYSVYSSFSGWSRKALEFNVPHCFKSEASKSSINASHFLENLDDSLRNLHLVSNVSRETYNFALNPYLVDQPLPWLHGWQVLADQLILSEKFIYPGRPTAFDEPSEVAWTLAPDSAIDTSWDGILIRQSSNMLYLWSQHNF